MLTLDKLKPGMSAVVKAVNGEESALRRHILAQSGCGQY